MISILIFLPSKSLAITVRNVPFLELRTNTEMTQKWASVTLYLKFIITSLNLN